MAVDDWPPPEQLPDRIARLRRALGVENEDIAQAIAIPAGTISKWVGGQSPKGENLLALARYFGVSVEYLLDGTVQPGWTRPEVSPKPKRGATGEKGREAPAVSTKRRRKKA